MGTGWQARGVPGCGPWRRERGDCPQQLRQDVRMGAPKIDPPRRQKFWRDAGRVPPRGAGPTPARTVGHGASGASPVHRSIISALSSGVSVTSTGPAGP